MLMFRAQNVFHQVVDLGLSMKGLSRHCTGSFWSKMAAWEEAELTSFQEHVTFTPIARAIPPDEEVRADSQPTRERPHRHMEESQRHHTVDTPANTLPCSPEGSWEVPHRLACPGAQQRKTHSGLKDT